MSLKRCQREVDSPEFTDWLAFYTLEAEMMDPNREPTPDEIGNKFANVFALHNAKLAAKEAGKVTKVPR